RKKRPRKESCAIYVYKVLKNVHPRLSSEGDEYLELTLMTFLKASPLRLLA
ncbi:unnamed protein product, partial [Tetraodon nigroviridis]